MRARSASEAQVSAVFLVGYGALRFIAEYFREPDALLGMLALNMSMGQWLCVPMIFGGRAAVGLGARRATCRAGRTRRLADCPLP